MRKIAILLAALLAVLAVAPAQAREKVRVPQSLAQLKLSFAPVVKKVRPAVVNVYARQVVRARRRLPPLFDDPFFREFFGGDPFFGMPEERLRNSLGSGVIVSKDGKIVTNSHVIENAVDIRVVLADGRELPAKVLLSDVETDLALLQVKAEKPLPVLKLGDSDALEVGDVVLAIGNPFGVGQTVTMGIVSGLARTRIGRSPYQAFIQTDAAINPGNSGGALVNLKGELVGINTMIVSRSGGNIGLGFAIPANLVRTMLASVGKGRVERAWGGVKLRTIDADMAEALGLERPFGALVERLHPKSPLKAAGIRVGDVIVAVDGKRLAKASEFGYRLASKPVGTDAIIEVLRKGRRISYKVRRMPPPFAIGAVVRLGGRHLLAGLRVADLPPRLQIRVGDGGGVLVVGTRGAPAARFGIRRGDVILEVNGRKVHSVRELQALLAATRRVFGLTIWRRGGIVRMRFG